MSTADAGPTTVYADGNVITADGEVLEHRTIVTRGSRILAIGDPDTLGGVALDSAERMDLEGRYVLPGLIDAHQHVATPPDWLFATAQYERDVYGGITTVRDMADDLRSIAELARAADRGEIIAPNIRFAALVAGPSFFEDVRVLEASRGWAAGTAPWMQAVSGDTDLREVVSIARGTGAHALKIYADLDRDLVARLSREARRQGMKVWAHGAVFPATPGDVVAAAPDAVSHARLLAYEGEPEYPRRYHDRRPADASRFDRGVPREVEQLLERMSTSGVILDATLLVDRPDGAPTDVFPLAAAITARARELGVSVAAGTDGFSSPEHPFPALHEELRLLVDYAGFSPLEAIGSATAVAAAAAGVAADRGAIVPGLRADFIALRDNPLLDISALASISLTVLGGVAHHRQDFDPAERADQRIEEQL